MKFYRTLLAGVAIAVLLAGCVSTTTGPKQAVPDKKEAADLNYQLGARYYRNGNYDLARDRLKKSLEIDSKNAIAWSTLALAYEQLGNERLATESYQKALKTDPHNFDVQNAYGVFLCRNKHFDEAQQHFDRSIAATENDDSEVMLTNAGVCMVQKPDNALAEHYFREALKRKTNYGEALLQMALLKHNTGDDLIARAFVQRYLVTNKPTAPVLYLGAQIEDALHDDKARKAYEDRMLREFPKSAETSHVLEKGHDR